jgi:hypothetical protein
MNVPPALIGDALRVVAVKKNFSNSSSLIGDVGRSICASPAEFGGGAICASDPAGCRKCRQAPSSARGQSGALFARNRESNGSAALNSPFTSSAPRRPEHCRLVDQPPGLNEPLDRDQSPVIDLACGLSFTRDGMREDMADPGVALKPPVPQPQLT